MSEPLIDQIAAYVAEYDSPSDEAMDTAKLCLIDSIACAHLALQMETPKRLLGPFDSSYRLENGCRVIGTEYQLNPIEAAFQNGLLIRWLDYNDTWLAAEWGHPSDNLGGLISVSDHLDLSVDQLLKRMVQAYEIQGILALSNPLNRVGLDHVLFVKIATAAVATHMLGGSKKQISDAISQAWIDNGSLRTYRHAPNTGPRKSWAAGDATARGVFLAHLTCKGEPGYETPLQAPDWGFQDVVMNGTPLTLERDLGCYVMENILFKVSFPAEFHAQTAVEAAISLHSQVKDRIQEIDSILIETQESAVRIIDKTGPLQNPADRDHCIQYMTAVALLKGNLTAEDYEDEVASNPNIDELRKKMTVKEDLQFTKDYLDPNKRSIGNRITIELNSGETLGPVTVKYPIGHRQRRKEALPLLKEKALKSGISKDLIEAQSIETMPVRSITD